MKTPWWFLHKTLMSFLLWPASLVYYAASRVVYFVRRRHAYVSRRSVICVGNIFAGGVGKTPIVREIAMRIDAPVVMRGYKKSANTGNAGDEALMLARSGLQVHTGNRRAAIELLNAQQSSAPIVMDDGFQNPTIKKDISILVFDDGLGYGNGFMLPAGPLREPKFAARRADAIIVIKSRHPRKKFKLPRNVPVFYATNQTVSPYDENERIFAFSGIGYPKKFFNAIGGNVVGTRAFPDHWQYTDQDIEKLVLSADAQNAKLLTTEKDWVRLPARVRDKIKYAQLKTVIDNAFFDWLKEKLENDNTGQKN